MKKIISIILVSFLFVLCSVNISAEGYTYYGPYRSQDEESFKNSDAYKQGHADGYNKAYTDALQKYNLTVNGDIAPLWTVYVAIGITAVVCIGGMLWYFNSKTRKIKKIFLPICYGIINDLDQQMNQFKDGKITPDYIESLFLARFLPCKNFMKNSMKNFLLKPDVKKKIPTKNTDKFYMLALTFIPIVGYFVRKKNLVPFEMTYSVVTMQKMALDISLDFGYINNNEYEKYKKQYGIDFPEE